MTSSLFRGSLYTGVLSASLFTSPSLLLADTIWSPMWDQRSTPMTWEVKADGPTLVANSFNVDFATYRVTTGDGLTTLATVSGVGDLSSGPVAVTPGQIYRVVYDSGFHVRPNWTGIEWARLGPGAQAPGPGSALGFQSDAELGFDERWGHLPSQFADTTWKFLVAQGETLSVSVEHMTGNVSGAAKFEFISPSGVVTVVDADGMPGSGGLHFQARGGNLGAAPDPNSVFWDSYTAPTSEPGFWGFKLYAKDGPNNPYSWHYVLDRTDSGADQNAYLRVGSIRPPNPVPDRASTSLLLVVGLGGLGLLRRGIMGRVAVP